MSPQEIAKFHIMDLLYLATDLFFTIHVQSQLWSMALQLSTSLSNLFRVSF